MYQAPIITFFAGFPGEEMESSLFDIRVTSAGVYNPLFPTSGTLYDGWCLDRSVQIPANTVHTGAVYSSYELGVLAANVPTLSANPNLGNLDNINWLLNHYTGTNYTFGEVQGAIWQLMGSDPFASYVGVQNAANITALVNLALANDGYVPDAGETIGVVIDPFSGSTHYQPLIIETKAAKIGDFVWHDRNADGIQDAGEEGIAGASVKLVRDMDGNGSISADEVLATTTTGANGDYSFKGLTPGLSYQVMFTLPSTYNGVSPFQADGNPNSDANSDGLMSGVVVLAPGEYNRTIDAGFYKFASIGDRVWLDANANGRQDDGEAGVAGVTVRLLDASGNVVTTMTTGAEGQYHFTGLVPSTYSVEFVRPDGFVFTQAGAPGVEDDLNSDANTGTGRTVATVLESGENDLSWDAGLMAGTPTPARISGYVYEDFGNDGVRGAGEPPLAGVLITLTGTDDLGQPVSLSTTTDGNGFYEFANLRPGTYAVAETQPGAYLDGKDTAGSTGGVVTNDTISSIPLLAGQSSENNNFGELVPAQIRGVVYCDDNNDGIRQAGEAGLGGVTITLTGTDDRGQAVSATTTTATDGSYAFLGLRPGTYSVAEPTQPAGKLDGKDSAGLFGGGVAGNDVINNIVLTQGLISDNNNFGEILPAKISGYVYEDLGDDGVRNSEPGIAGATVTLTGTNDLGQAVTLTATTAADGYYEFADLRPGTYKLTETQPGGFADGKDTAGSAGGVVSNDMIDQIVVGAGQASTDNNFGELRNLVGAEIRGFVYCDDNDDGTRQVGEIGLAGVTVTLSGTDNLGAPVSATTTTGADGSYAFTGLRPGTYSVTETTLPADKLDGKDTAGAPGGGVAGEDTITGIVLTEGMVSNLNNFGEILPAKLSGYVYEDFGNDGVRGPGEPVIGLVNITLTGTDDKGNAVTRTATTDINGYYEFANLRPGTYAVAETQPVAYLDGKDTAGSTGGTAGNDLISAIPLTAGQHSQNNNFGELVGAQIRGVVYCDDNNDGIRQGGEVGLAGVTVTLSGTDDLGNTVTASTTTGLDGSYIFAGLRPGTYSVAEPTQPAGKLDGKDSAGLFGGGVAGNDVINNIVLTQGLISDNNNFGEIKPSSVSGFVYCDTNDNGVRQAGEVGLAGVEVKLTGTNDLGQAVDLTVTTGADGSYRFDNLRPGTYSVSEPTQPADKIDGRDTAGSTPGSVAGNDVILNIVLGTGQDSTDNNFGEIKPSAIEGFVYCDDNNDGIKQGTEQGLAGVQVRLTGSNDLGQPVDVTVTTGADGSYRFDMLRPGVYTVTELTQPAGKDDGKDTAGSAGGNTSVNDQISGIVLGPDTTSTGNNFGELLPPGAQVSGFVYCDENNDGVKQAGDVGLAGVTVNLTGTDDLGAAVSLTTTTGADGSYAFTGLRAGTYTVTETSQPAGKLDGQETAGSTGGNTGVNEVISGITVAAGQSSVNNNFGEIKPSSIAGFVYCDDNNDGIKQATDVGLAGVTVNLTGTNDLGQAVSLSTTTGADGSYSFTGLRPGTYAVSEPSQPAGKDDGKETAGSTGGNTGVNDQISGIVLGSGVDSTGNNFGELLPAAAKITGFVYCDDNNDGVKQAGDVGLAGVTVKLTGTNDLGAAVSLSTTTGADGSYAFTGLRAGIYTVTETTQPAGKLDGKETAGSTGGNTGVNEVISGITLATGQTSSGNNFGEILPAKLSGYVYEDKGNDGLRGASEPAIAGVTVKLTGTNDLGQAVTATTTTNAAGYYEFANLRPGSYKVTETQPTGFLDGKDTAGSTGGTVSNDMIASIPLAAGQHSQNNNFGELKAASLGDKVWFDCNANGVQDAGEAGVSGVTVNLLDATGAVLATTTTNASGNYLFSALTPGDYVVQFVPLSGYSFTAKDAGGDGVDSDANTSTGKTAVVRLDSGETNLTVDAGLLPQCRDVTFDFSGNTATDGTDGNSRNFTDSLTGVSVTARAFSQDKGTNTWQKAYLGAYSGGLGVTDSTEGSGGSDMHTIDNVGRNNYVVLQFSQAVVLDKAFLGYVVGDSDMQVWIGNASSAITTMSNSVLASMGFTEVNGTTSTSARWADLNAGGVSGNVIIIAADTTDTSPEDRFKLEKLAVCAPDLCLPQDKASIGNFVWEDKNFNGLQDTGEKGIAGVTVKLLNAGGTVVATTTTDASGAYLFSNINPADYKVQVVAPSGYFATKKDQGSNNNIDSDIDSSGTTALTTLSAGENDLSWDAGLYRKASVGDRVWEDENHNYIQDPGELGIGGISVKLLAADGKTVLASTTTNSSGNYLFNNLDPGSYMLQFDKGGVKYQGYKLDSWMWAKKDVGSNDGVDSDVAGDGVSKANVSKTDLFVLDSGENDMTRDAGITPIVIDLDGNGIQTLARSDSSAGFDLFGNGTLVKSGWISGSDGFLAVDRNGNGRIDDISELFGGNAKGQGFAQLASFDSNGDGLVNDLDAAFGQLMVWRDANGNRGTDAGELVTLAQAGVASLTVGYTELPFVDGQGNLHLERSSATMADGSAVSMTDVYFNVAAEDAQAAGVKLPTMAELLGEDCALDAVLGGPGMASTAHVALADESATGCGDTGEALRRLAALSRDEAHHAQAA